MALVGTVPGEISEAEFRKVTSKPLIKVRSCRDVVNDIWHHNVCRSSGESVEGLSLWVGGKDDVNQELITTRYGHGSRGREGAANILLVPLHVVYSNRCSMGMPVCVLYSTTHCSRQRSFVSALDNGNQKRFNLYPWHTHQGRLVSGYVISAVNMYHKQTNAQHPAAVRRQSPSTNVN